MIPNSERISDGLTDVSMVEAMRFIMDGKAADEDLKKFLLTLAERGETVDEITGAARVLREKALSITAPAGTLDCCGTGGDARSTYNISTAVALVAAACGVPIAKHGNRAASSKSGAADVLEALGINLNISKEKIEDALQKFNFAFLMAPNHHHAMKSVSAVRKSIPQRTIFNLLGPLANPAGTKFQLLGVYDEKRLRPMAEVLRNLGTTRAWIVHGRDGLDEITTTTSTVVAKLENGKITKEELTPADFGVAMANPQDLEGGDAEQNAKALTALLKGSKNAYRDIVLVNVAAVLAIHSDNANLKENVSRAAQTIDSGAALKLLENYKEFTNDQTG